MALPGMKGLKVHKLMISICDLSTLGGLRLQNLRPYILQEARHLELASPHGGGTIKTVIGIL